MEKRNWLVCRDEFGNWVAQYKGKWLPNSYDSKEEAIIALLDHLNDEDE